MQRDAKVRCDGIYGTTLLRNGSLSVFHENSVDGHTLAQKKMSARGRIHTTTHENGCPQVHGSHWFGLPVA
jgi:hypothetical protein